MLNSFNLKIWETALRPSKFAKIKLFQMRGFPLGPQICQNQVILNERLPTGPSKSSYLKWNVSFGPWKFPKFISNERLSSDPQFCWVHVVSKWEIWAIQNSKLVCKILAISHNTDFWLEWNKNHQKVYLEICPLIYNMMTFEPDMKSESTIKVQVLKIGYLPDFMISLEYLSNQS